MNEFLQGSVEVAGITTAVKVLVDIIKARSLDRPTSLRLPMIALGLGLLFAVLLAMSQGPAWSLPLVATTIIRGVMGGAGAVGVTEIHKMSRAAGANTLPIVPEVE